MKAMGVIFETGSAKFLGFGEETCKFYSSWEDASQVEWSKWSTGGNRENMIDYYRLKYCKDTLVFLELIYDEKLDRVVPDYSVLRNETDR